MLLVKSNTGGIIEEVIEMTGKRFTHKKWYNERQLFDGEVPFAIVDVYIQAEEICNKLNEVADENKELKKEVQEQERRKWACLKEAHRLDLENERAWNLIRFIYNEIKEDGYMGWKRIQDLEEEFKNGRRTI